MAWVDDVKRICTEDILVPFEGYHLALPDGSCKAYPDPYSAIGKGLIAKKDIPFLSDEQLIKAGHPWTIGFGSTFDIDGSPVKPGMIWSRQKAIEVKQHVLSSFLKTLLLLSPSLVKQPAKRVAGILSWFYNLGPGNYRVSTFKRKIDREEWTEAGEECKKWNKAGGVVSRGLQRRRNLEALYIAGE